MNILKSGKPHLRSVTRVLVLRLPSCVSHVFFLDAIAPTPVGWLVGWLVTDTFRFSLCWCQSKENVCQTILILELSNSAKKPIRSFFLAKLSRPKAFPAIKSSQLCELFLFIFMLLLVLYMWMGGYIIVLSYTIRAGQNSSVLPSSYLASHGAFCVIIEKGKESFICARF